MNPKSTKSETKTIAGFTAKGEPLTKKENNLTSFWKVYLSRRFRERTGELK